MRHPVLFASLLLVGLTACHSRHRHVEVVPTPSNHHVSIEVEVYDPVTNLVWEGAGVRIEEAWVEWSGRTRRNPDTSVWYLTDSIGTALFTSADLADAQVGFLEDPSYRAVLEPGEFVDEAIVQVEVSAPGFPTVLVDVLVTWDEPNVFVSIPFSP